MLGLLSIWKTLNRSWAPLIYTIYSSFLLEASVRSADYYSSNKTGFGWIFAFQMGWKEIKRRWVTFHVHICFYEYYIPSPLPTPPSPPPPSHSPARSLLTVYCYCDSALDEMWAKNMSLLNTGLSEVVCISLQTPLPIYDSQSEFTAFYLLVFLHFQWKVNFLTDFNSYLCRVELRFSFGTNETILTLFV